MIDNRLNESYAIRKSSPQATKQFVEKAIEPIEDRLNQLHSKVDELLSKSKKYKNTLPLRNPIDMNLFPIFFTNAGSKAI